MASAADVDLEFGLSGLGNEGVTTGAVQGALQLFGMDTLLHDGFSLMLWFPTKARLKLQYDTTTKQKGKKSFRGIYPA